MLIIRGVNVFPSQVESLLHEVAGGESAFQLVVDRKGPMDEATLLVEAGADPSFEWERRQTGVLAEAIRKRLAHDLGIALEVKLAGEGTLERVEGKVRRVVDRRML
ncbi:MAG TPA: hypothetical protein DD658_02180 [Deltaproteobacteria bacterium]|nr:hypothetical protein [Deltaproteobacteria bacterium]